MFVSNWFPNHRKIETGPATVGLAVLHGSTSFQMGRRAAAGVWLVKQPIEY